MEQTTPESPPWGTTTKALVGLALIMLITGLLLRFQTVVPLLLLSVIVSLLVVPVVQFLHYRLGFPWSLAANLIMLTLIFGIIGASTATGYAIVQQLQALFLIVQDFLVGLPEQLSVLSEQSIPIGPWTLELSQLELTAVGEQFLAAVQPLLGEVSSIITSLATGAIESLAGIVFVIAITYFLVLDYNRIRSAVINISIPGYREDLRRLRIGLMRVWQAFLRGQLLLVLSSGLLTYALMGILGVRFAIGLGVLGGLAKFAPIVGPWIAGLIAALVAIFQPSNWFGLTPVGFGLLVVVCVVILTQVIDVLLIPRIMGTSLNLHPVVVLIGLLIGATLAGVIGLLLSSPTIASLVLLGRYTYRKMFDLSPWDPPIDVIGARESLDPRMVRLWRRLTRSRKEN